MTGEPVLLALTQAAMASTAAAAGWLLAVDGDQLRVVAAAGGSDPGTLLGRTLPAGSGSAGFVAASGQPLAISLRPDDPRFAEGMTALTGRAPSSVLAVPCSTDDGVAGVLELVDKAGGAPFSIDDVELASVLADVAGVALTTGAGAAPPVATPAHLAAGLERLAVADPARYAAVAVSVEALLARG